MGALLVVGGLSGGLALWRGRSAPTHAGALKARSAVVVLPFSVEGGAAVEDLRDGMVDLLSTALDGAGDLRSVDPHAVLAYHRQLGGAAVAGPSEAGAVAEHFGARFYLLGTVVEAGGRVSITAQLYDRQAAAEPLIRASSQGTVEQLFQLVDSVTAQLLVGRLDEPSERLARLAGLTTRSLPALKAYLQGEQNVRLAHYERAADAYAHAVTMDSSFALAYYRLSAASEWGFDFIRAHAAANRALAFGERLSEPDWLLLRAWSSFVSGDAAQAQQQYEDLVANRPDDVEAWAGLGEVFVHYNAERGRSMRDARPAFERALALGGDYGEVRFHLLELAAQRRDSATFHALLAGVLPEDRQYLPWQAVGAYAWGDAGARARMTATLARADEITLGIAVARVATAVKDFPAAEGLARALTGAERPAAWRAGGHLTLAELALAEGRPRAARAELAIARPLEPSWSLELGALAAALPFLPSSRPELLALRDSLRAWRPEQRAPNLTFFLGTHADAHALLRPYLIGVVDVQLGDVPAAQDALRELRGVGLAPDAVALRESLARSLRAWIARREGRPAEALALLSSDEFHPPLERIALSPFYARALERFARAELLEESGKSAEALRWYGTLSDSYDFIFAAPAHLQQARIYDRLGDRARARYHLAQFVRLWDAAEPELQPTVQAARARLAQLGG